MAKKKNIRDDQKIVEIIPVSFKLSNGNELKVKPIGEKSNEISMSYKFHCVDINTYNYYSEGMSYDELAEAAYNEHGWEIAGYYRGNVATRYHDQRRMNRLKDYFEYRLQNPGIEVVKQWLRENPDKADLVTVDELYLQERVQVTGTWDDSKMYAPYPAVDTSLYPSLKK